LFNRSAVKDHALKCSKEKRAGKFTRVGSDFFDEIEADVETFVREIRVKYHLEPSERVQPDETALFVTGDLLDKVRDELNAMLPRMVQRKVQRQPSCGVTIGRTR
jgi:hypothetical protein